MQWLHVPLKNRDSQVRFLSSSLNEIIEKLAFGYSVDIEACPLYKNERPSENGRSFFIAFYFV